ncbi:MAG: transporter [Verrucomicrobia bacterium]|nr:MAG: transporter [Verrucomicrobiota bacterium]
MLKSQLIHPDILQALASSGHFSQVLIADGNYPVATGTNPLAKRVHLNLRPGLVSCLDVLEVLLTAIPVQEATVMAPPSDFHPEIHDDYKRLLGPDVSWSEMERWAFYDKIKSPNTSLVIATGEQRRFANLLLTIGVVKLPTENF